MAINDISLTFGMRSNLLSLQGTVDLLDRTQSRLSSGKKVNTAMDNPVSFFAAQALTSRASVIDSLKDAMGQAVQTITAADKGITAISSLIEQAKGIAQQALSADAAVTVAIGGISINGLSAGGGFATSTLGLNSVAELNVITFRVNGVGQLIGFQADYTAATPEKYLLVDGDMNATASNLAAKITARDYTGEQWRYEAQYVAGTNTLDIFKYDIGTGLQVDFVAADFGASNGWYSKTVNPVPAADHIEIGGVAFTATNGPTSGQEFNVSGNNTSDMEQLAQTINDYAWGSTAYSAEVNNGQLVLYKTVGGAAVSVEAGDFDASSVTGGGSADMTLENTNIPSAELVNLQAQYNEMRTQIDDLADDSGYKGKNLLNAGTTLTVKFEGTHKLDVTGFDATVEGLAITSASGIAAIPLPDQTWTSTIADIGPPIMIETPADWTAEDNDDFYAHLENYRFFTDTGVIVGSGVVVAGSISNGQSVTWERYANGVNQTTGEPNPVTVNSWIDPGGIENSLAELDNALVILRQESSRMSGNLSIISVRQNFSTNMINTLTAGADKLTLADTNEEGANMLMLQTRQSLSTTALSLSAQAAQSVLKLFG